MLPVKKIVFIFSMLVGIVFSRTFVLEQTFAQVPTPCADKIWGCVEAPTNITSPQRLFTNTLRVIFFVGGIWAFINIITAGFQFMNAAGDPKAIQAAWGRIWQSLLGLLIIASSFVISAIVGYLIFKDPLFMFKAPVIK